MARVALWCYPRAFRRVHAKDFVEIALDRYGRERQGRTSGLTAVVRVAAWLAWDTAISAPRTWLAAGADPARDPQASLWHAAVTGLGGDARSALRLLHRQPVLSALVILTLGLGLGLGAASFDALDRVVLRPIPVPDGDRFVYIALKHPQLGWRFAPPPALMERWRTSARAIDAIEAYEPRSVPERGADGTSMVNVVGISAGLPSFLSAQPLLGRMLGPADALPAAPPVVMVSERDWRRRFGSDPAVVGRTVALEDDRLTIVGVWPDSVRFSELGTPAYYRMLPSRSGEDAWSMVLARPAAGANLVDVERELGQFLPEFTDLPPGLVATLVPAYGFLAPAYVTGLWLAFAAGVVLMAIAVVNVANVQLGRALGREAEMGVRRAVGGSRFRLVRLFFVESAVVTSLGLVLAAAVALAVNRLVAAYAPDGLRLDEAGWPAVRALAVATVGACVACALCALVPLRQARATSLQAASGRAGGRTTAATSRLRRAFVVVQAALAVLLAFGALLLGRSLRQIAAVDVGFDVDRVAVASVRVSADAGAELDEAAAAARQARVRDTLAALPGVQSLTTSNAPLFRAALSSAMPYLESEPEPAAGPGAAFSTVVSVPGNYFAVLGIDLVAGRAFMPGERGSVIVNEAFARSRGGPRVVGQRLRMSASRRRPPGAAPPAPLLVVGIARDIRSLSVTDDPNRVQLYMPAAELGAYATYVLRIDGDPAAVLASARAALHAADPRAVLELATTGARLFREQTARHRFIALVLAVLAGLGLLFAVTGVYGVVSLDVNRRTREMGVRVALGATAAHVIRDVMRRALGPVCLGASAGVLGALWAGPFMIDLLFGVTPRDAWSVGQGVGVVLASAALAVWRPALRASRMDPAQSLKSVQ